MANEFPPYMNATGILQRVLKKAQVAPPPSRFTQDFLTTKLGFKKGSANAVIPFFKRIGLLGSDGVPTEIYKQFRNESKASQALAEGIRTGYADMYSRNEYFHNLDKDELVGLIVEATGTTKTSSTVKSILRTLDVLRQFTDFEIGASQEKKVEKKPEIPSSTISLPTKVKGESGLGVNLAYTINLNLPETSDITVFDAIFKSLKENLLKND